VRIPRRIVLLIYMMLPACVVLCSCDQLAFGFQADSKAIEEVRQAMNRIAAISSVSLAGSYSSQVQKLKKLRFERLGSRWSLEGDVLTSIDNAQIDKSTIQLRRIRELLGNEMPEKIFFDGQFTYEYRPAALRLEISDFDLGTERAFVRPFDPVFWLTPFPGLPLPSILTNGTFSRGEDGHYSLHLTLQPSTEGIRVAYKDLIIKFDEEQGWNWTEFEMTGGAVGQLKHIREWKLSSDHWYVFRGSIERAHTTIENWEVSEITFDPRKVVSTFMFAESSFPNGIEIRDALPGEVKENRFVGGADGKRQNRLLRAAESLSRTTKEKNE